ncbi:DnaJ family molecular chaperone [Puniceibacterium sp. IMCC21224]|uniref:J domain-containing protein n=1 Tax=Puniceibacterium sp. IMCC21224 TaxID=1618204 RepID=UPI00064E0954|nr:DnaJ family molecular chaperone [Puniceibacterium sp. IMCC21224]KMK68670.1 protein with DnaJ-like domain [Puniceibacterium sp. IMCC21224]
MTTTSIWQRILAYLDAAGQAVRKSLEPRAPTDTVAFSIAFIALAAKMAKADGIVTRDEVTMFRRVFDIPPEEEANAARVFNLCRQETTGFEAYARQLSNVLPRTPSGDTLRQDVLDGLFHIAVADSKYHPAESAFLRRVTEIFGLSDDIYLVLRARHVPALRDPYRILGVSTDVSLDDLRAVRKQFVRENHPDQLIANGLPKEMIELANARLADFNDAYEEIAKIKSGSRIHLQGREI